MVLLRHAGGTWAACISTDTSLSVEAILKIVSGRWSIEEHFDDVKEIWGVGEQQVRNVWSGVGCWNLCGWLYALVEFECWDEASECLVDRSDRPWDNPLRRPSHNDRRRRIAREMLSETLLGDLTTAPQNKNSDTDSLYDDRLKCSRSGSRTKGELVIERRKRLQSGDADLMHHVIHFMCLVGRTIAQPCRLGLYSVQSRRKVSCGSGRSF
ncbi:hypothetical protein Poly41_26580 [Novipirellula artificiosorum]|uniref:Transposase IS4-like domain-containing protein n=1 Tax=Novipirellula artificiosorum TaxID=2528016 RepID=A0A5C6DSZ9_9BACT|nr:hypothetical protein Poly41_26580 [Novipirellula artificiosorum]